MSYDCNPCLNRTPDLDLEQLRSTLPNRQSRHHGSIRSSTDSGLHDVQRSGLLMMTVKRMWRRRTMMCSPKAICGQVSRPSSLPVRAEPTKAALGQVQLVALETITSVTVQMRTSGIQRGSCMQCTERHSRSTLLSLLCSAPLAASGQSLHHSWPWTSGLQA